MVERTAYGLVDREGGVEMPILVYPNGRGDEMPSTQFVGMRWKGQDTSPSNPLTAASIDSFDAARVSELVVQGERPTTVAQAGAV